MAEIPTSDYLHRSIDQLRSMNERGVLSSLGHLTTTDLRAAHLVQDYKPFDIANLRQNVVDRLDYTKSVLDNSATHRQHNSTSAQQQQQQQQQQQHQQHNHQGDSTNHHQRADETSHEQQRQISNELKQSYSAPSTPPTPLSDAQMGETKLFTSKSEIQMHNNQTHIREAKPYKCTQCAKSFANSSYLSQHTRIHLGIKPYRCEICQRKFTQLSHLQQHIRTHTGDKPYKCRHPGCQKAFSQLSNLQSHSRCHQTDKPYKCNSCYKCFSDENALLEHIPKHKESKHLKTHICSFCGKSYTQETYLQKHIQKHAEKAEKQSRNSINNNNNNNSTIHTSNLTPSGVALAAGLGLNLNRNLAMNVAVNGEHSYWPKVSPDSAATLAEAMQQQQSTYEFALAQQQSELQNHHRSLLEHQRTLNGGGNTNGTNANSTGANNSQNSNEEGEDLVINRGTANSGNQQNSNNLAQHLSNSNQQQQQQQQQTSPATNSVITTNGSFDGSNATRTTANSAFTPINSMAPHINSLSHHAMAQRPYIYDALQFQTKNVTQNTANSFPNQLISLHQIRNYAHQPSAAVAAGLMTSEHLLGIGVGGATIKDKAQ